MGGCGAVVVAHLWVIFCALGSVLWGPTAGRDVLNGVHWMWRVQGLDSLLHGEGVVCLEVLLLMCSGNVSAERISSGIVGLGT